MPRFRRGDLSALTTPSSQIEPWSSARPGTESRQLTTSASATGRVYPAWYGTAPAGGMLANVWRDPVSTQYVYFNYVFSRGACTIADLKVGDNAIASVPWIDLWDSKEGDNVQTVNSVWSGRVPGFVETYPGRCGVWFRAVDGRDAVIPGQIKVTATLTRKPLSNYGSGTGDSSKLDLICYDIWTNLQLWKLGRDPSEIDTTSWQAWGAWTHTLFSGTPRFSYNGPIYEEDQETALKIVLSHGRAQHYQNPDDGKVHIWYNGTATPTGASIAQGDWIDGPYSNHRPVHSQASEVSVTYYGPDDGPRPFARVKVDTIDPQVVDPPYDMPGLDYAQAYRWAQSEQRHQTLEPLNWSGTVKRLSTSKLGDVILMTTRDGKIVNQLVRIVNMARNLQGTAMVELNEYDANAQSTAEVAADTPPATGPLVGSQPPSGTYDLQTRGIYDEFGKYYYYEAYSWTPPTGFEYYSVEIWFQLTAGGEYEFWASAPSGKGELNVGEPPPNDGVAERALPSPLQTGTKLYLTNNYNLLRTEWTLNNNTAISGTGPTLLQSDVLSWNSSTLGWINGPVPLQGTTIELTKQISSGAITITEAERAGAAKIRVYVQVESGTEDDLDSVSAPDGVILVLIPDDSAKTINCIANAASSDPLRLDACRDFSLDHRRDTLTLEAAATGARELARSYNEGMIEEDVRVATFFLGPAANVPRVRQFKTDGGAPASVGTFLYYFEDNKYQHLFFNAQLPHARLNGSDIYPHVHYVFYGSLTGTYTVEFEHEYNWANIDASFATSNTVVTITDTVVDPVAGKHYVAWGSAITGTGKTESSMLVCRISRDAGVASSDTYPGDIGILEFDYHIEDTGVGSYEG
jgi:hypothetical protein